MNVHREPERARSTSPAELERGLFKDRLAMMVERSGLGKRGFAREAGISYGALVGYLKGGEPTRPIILSMAHAGKIDPLWLMTGDIRDAGLPTRPSARPVAAPGFADDQAPYGLTRVPVYELRLSAGSGEPTWASEKPRDFLDLPTEYISRTLRLNPSQAVAFPVVGDSMDPTIRDGELAVLDRSERSIERDGAIYALRRADGLMVKRVFRSGAGFTLRSDNPTFGTEDVPRSEWDEIQILGRVGGALRRV